MIVSGAPRQTRNPSIFLRLLGHRLTVRSWPPQVSVYALKAPMMTLPPEPVVGIAPLLPRGGPILVIAAFAGCC